jgi:hypothetical protein
MDLADRPLAPLLGIDRPVLLDGGMGTLLESRAPTLVATELWRLENPGRSALRTPSRAPDC